MRRGFVERALGLALGAWLAVVPVSASAISIQVFGDWGASGEAGDVGLDGVAGEDGEAVIANAATADATNEAWVRGGVGGDGGDGGPPAAGIDGGDGGDSGAGGSAEATAQSSGPGLARASAEADGGRAGYAGYAGSAVNTSSVPGLGAEGGDAVAESTASSNGGTADADAEAEGGTGGYGRTGGAAGSADARAEASATNGASARAIAEGGNGGGILGATSGVGVDGGVATATARATVSGSGSAGATAHQIGGGGGGGWTRGGAGADSLLDDAVSGSVPGSGQGCCGPGWLYLEQRAEGGAGGTATVQGGDGGDAVSTIDATNPGGGSLYVVLSARGGEAGRGATAGNAGSASVSGTATSEREVRLYATATGGVGAAGILAGSPGQTATLGSLFGRSLGGGSVLVYGAAYGGESGYPVLNYQEPSAGGSALVVDAVDGETTGTLTLEQHAIGGTSRGAPAHGESRLTRATHASAAIARVVGSGGGAADGGSSGNGTAFLRLSNDAGSVQASAEAWGGDALADAAGSTSGADHSVLVSSSSRGGVAEARADGTATGDSRVSVSATANGGRTATAHATGSNQGSAAVDVLATASGTASATPGTATADAFGSSQTGTVLVKTALNGGNGYFAPLAIWPVTGGSIDAIDTADGTTGGALTLHQIAFGGGGSFGGGAGGAGGDGGAASSLLRAANRAGAALTVIAEAQGGYGGQGASTGPGGAGGAATASARGEEAGAEDVTVLARAIGGEGGHGGTGGAGGLATIGEAYGRSGTGTVHVTGWATGGSGEDGFGGPPGSGSSVSLIDVVDGETAGHLTLEQIAEGGLPGSSNVPSEINAGDATSQLTRTKSAARLTLRSTARQAISYYGSLGAEGSHADARADAENDAGDAEVFVLALGGFGTGYAGPPGTLARGGDALAEARARTLGDGHDILIGELPPAYEFDNVRAGAVGGAAGRLIDGDFADPESARGGNASSTSTGIAEGDSVVRVIDFARGGWGGEVQSGAGFRGGVGGAASSLAHGENQGSSAVSVRAEAVGGRGGQVYDSFAPRRGGEGGTAHAEASGRSVSGAVDVTVIQRSGNGGFGENAPDGTDSSSIDAVSGSTGGQLVLLQQAIGGNGGSQSNYRTPIATGAGGDAFCSLEATNPGGGALELTARAVGGFAGASAPGMPGANGGAAHAAAQGRDATGAALVVRAQAVGGGGGLEFSESGGAGGAGGQATLGPVFGESSAAGDVTVIGETTGGAGGRSSAGGAGADAVLENAVDGATAGGLTLVQRARGGLGGEDDNSGSARSALTKSGGFARLALEVEAVGRMAEADANASNTSGDVDVVARAEGFLGDDAAASAFGEAFAEDAGVTVGRRRESPVYPYAAALASGARGGDASFSANGNGGAARSSSAGVHHGEGEVRVFDVAIGGNGDVGRYGATPADARGGAAFSRALASNQGDALVHADAFALGGGLSARSYLQYGGAGGNADATAEASGLGDTLATARAVRGYGFTGLPGPTDGTAVARASATGRDGFASATATEALSNYRQTGLYELSAYGISEAASARSGAFVGEGSLPTARPADVQAFAAAVANPLDGGVLLAGQRLLARGQLTFEHVASDATSLQLEGGVELAYVRGEATGLRVGFLDAELLGGLARLEVIISDGGREVWSKSFKKPEKAAAYLEDRSIAVKSKLPKHGEPPPAVLSVRFVALLLAAGDGIVVDFVVSANAPSVQSASRLTSVSLAVPEPRLALLVALALATTGWRLRRRAQPPVTTH